MALPLLSAASFADVSGHTDGERMHGGLEEWTRGLLTSASVSFFDRRNRTRDRKWNPVLSRSEILNALPMSESVSRTLQVGKRGVVTLPKDFREAYGIEEGDALHLVDLGGGAFAVTPMMPTIPSLVEEIETIREEEGVSLEDLIAGLRRERERLTREVYGDEPENDGSPNE